MSSFYDIQWTKVRRGDRGSITNSVLLLRARLFCAENDLWYFISYFDRLDRNYGDVFAANAYIAGLNAVNLAKAAQENQNTEETDSKPSDNKKDDTVVDAEFEEK